MFQTTNQIYIYIYYIYIYCTPLMIKTHQLSPGILGLDARQLEQPDPRTRTTKSSEGHPQVSPKIMKSQHINHESSLFQFILYYLFWSVLCMPADVRVQKGWSRGCKSWNMFINFYIQLDTTPWISWIFMNKLAIFLLGQRWGQWCRSEVVSLE